MAGHGQPRLTEGLDVFVDPTPANGRRLRDALVAFGFEAVAPSAEELALVPRCPPQGMVGRCEFRTGNHRGSVTYYGDDVQLASDRNECGRTGGSWSAP